MNGSTELAEVLGPTGSFGRDALRVLGSAGVKDRNHKALARNTSAIHSRTSRADSTLDDNRAGNSRNSTRVGDTRARKTAADNTRRSTRVEHTRVERSSLG